MAPVQQEKLGLDVIDEPLKAAARSLLEQVKQTKRVEAFRDWQEHAALETSIRNAEAAVKPYEAILNAVPQDRSREDIHKICGLLRQMRAYKNFAPHILELIAAHCRLLVVWEGVELPRTGEEASHLYNVICGNMQCVSADPKDPLILYTVYDTAVQILREEEAAAAANAAAEAEAAAEAAAQESSSSAWGQKFKDERPDPSTSPFVSQMLSSGNQTGTQADGSPEGNIQGATDEPSYISNADTLATYQLPIKCEAPSVASRMWRTVMARIQANKLPPRAEAESAVAARRDTQALRPSRQRTHRRSSTAGSKHATTDRVRVKLDKAHSVAKESARQSTEGARPDQRSEHGHSSSGAASNGKAAGAEGVGGASNPWPLISVVEMGRGDCFSGRELDCFNEVGLMEGGESLDIPQRVLAAVPVPNSVAALLVVSRAVYRRALDMVQDYTIGCAVRRCCRLPFLRHTPLKELYKLSRYLVEVRFSKGDVLIEQGKESTNLFLLVEGEVECVVDVPYTDDREVLETALVSKMQDSSSTLEGRSSVAASVFSSKTTPKTRMASYKGPLQRVVMARRGPGSILGDDGLREKKVAVGVVASSTSVLALTVSMQRFAMSVDPLTLRLFLKLKQQQGAMPLISEAVSAAMLSGQKVDRCREVILAQSYQDQVLPYTLVRDKGTLSGQNSLLQSLHGPSAGRKAPKPPWRAPVGAPQLPPTLSLDAGDRAEHLANLHKQNQSLFELEMRLEALATRGQKNDDHTRDKDLIEPKHSKDTDQTTKEPPTPVALASKSLTRSARTMRASLHSTAAPSVCASRKLTHGGSSHFGGGEAGMQKRESLGLGSLVPQSMTTSWLQHMQITESVAQLGNMIKQAGEKRKAEVLEQEHRNLQGRNNLVKVDARVIHKLDISVKESSGSSSRHTDMLEAACLATIKVHLLPGQLVTHCDVLAPVLDDAVVGWSTAAHNAQLQLVRWSSFEYALLARVDPSESKRAAVKCVADVLLEMKAHFEHIILTNAVPHFIFCAGLSIGGAFAQYDGGQFLTGISGTAVHAAEVLADAAVVMQAPHGAIFISDAAMQAVHRTHVLQFVGAAYELIGRVSMPCNTSVELFGSMAAEPVAKGDMPSELNMRGQDEDAGVDQQQPTGDPFSTAYSPWEPFPFSTGSTGLSDSPEPGTAQGYVSPQPAPWPPHTPLMQQSLPQPLSSPLASSWSMVLGDEQSPRSCHLQRSGSNNLSWDAQRGPVSSTSRQPHQPSSQSPQNQGVTKEALNGVQRRRRGGLTSAAALEPQKKYAQVNAMRTRQELGSSMDVRQRLRQDLHARRPNTCPGGIPSTPNTGMFWGGLQGHLKSWGLDGRPRNPPPIPQHSTTSTQHSTHSSSATELRPLSSSQRLPPSAHTSPAASPHAGYTAHTSRSHEYTHSQIAPHTLPGSTQSPPVPPLDLHTNPASQLRHHAQLQQLKQQHQQHQHLHHHAFTDHSYLPLPDQHTQHSLPSHATHTPPRSSHPTNLQPVRTGSLPSPHTLHPSLTSTSQPSNPSPLRSSSHTRPTHSPRVQAHQATSTLPQARSQTQATGSQATRPMLEGFQPGSGPLSSLSARRRASEMLFAGAALASSTAGLVRTIDSEGHAPAHTSDRPPSHQRGRRAASPLHTLGTTKMSHDSLDTAIDAAVRRMRASPEQLLPGRPDSPLQVLHRPLSADQRAHIASVTVESRPKSAGSSLGDKGPLSVASPAFKLRSSSPAQTTTQSHPSHHQQGPAPPNSIPSNFGYIPTFLLPPPRGTRPSHPTAHSPPSPQDSPRWFSQPSGPAGPPQCGTSPPQGPGAGLQRPHYHDQQVQHGATGHLSGRHARGLSASMESGDSLTPPQPSSPRGSTERFRSRRRGLGSSLSSPKKTLSSSLAASLAHSQKVDPYTGMSLALIHEQAVATWKDLGSMFAAQEYVQNLPRGQVNVSFSAAGLTGLPDLSRLRFLESLAASFNNLGLCPDPEHLLGSSPLPHLSIVSMSHGGLHQLPSNIGHLLPSLSELNLAHNSISEIPESLCRGCSALQAISLEHNRLSLLPDSLSRLTNLEALYVGGNQLRSLPDCLPNLPKLLVLNVSHNLIQELPANLSACTHLTAFSAAHNRLTTLPPSFLESLTNLRWLELQENSLRTCPQINGIQVSEAVAARDAIANQAASECEAQLSSRAGARPRSPLSAQPRVGSHPTLPSLAEEWSHHHSDSHSPSKLEDPQQQPQQAQGVKQKARGRVRRNTSGSVRISEPGMGGEAVPSRPPSHLAQGVSGAAGQKSLRGLPERRPSLLKRASGLKPAPSRSLLEDELQQEELAMSTPRLLPNLQFFNCANNRLALVPMWLPPSLTGLDLSRNCLPAVPSWLPARVPQLQLLALSGNCIHSVCEEVAGLHSLKMVSLDENPATDPDNPDSAGQWLGEHVRAAKFDHKMQLLAVLRGVSHDEQRQQQRQQERELQEQAYSEYSEDMYSQASF